jgi:hydrogenase maturation protein HypF
LASPEAPIVLLERLAGASSPLPESLAPGAPTLGCMLPSNPLHHLLMRELQAPLVATSGNRSDEPICIDEREALERLGGMAGLFLVHDRPIARHVDDSIVRLLMGRELVLRRARGYAPLPVDLPAAGAGHALAWGAHLKNSVALRKGGRVFLSQHLGDLDAPESRDALRRAAADLPELLGAVPVRAAHDLHPDYAGTREAKASGLPCVAVQHHWAHIAACMAENGLDGEVLGLAWDGTGLGTDQTVWGGEFLACGYGGFRRAGHLRTFRLPGGDAAARDPRRSLLGALHALLGPATRGQASSLPALASLGADLGLMLQALERKVNSPLTSSAGRLFDAAAALAGFSRTMRFEGQAAATLEFLLDGPVNEAPYPYAVLNEQGTWVLDWGPGLLAMAEDALSQVPPALMSARFHGMLVEASVALARQVGLPRVCLSGGCFQNRRLTERMVERLEAVGFRAYWHQRVPPNDGGIALGQAAIESVLPPVPAPAS